MQNVNLLTPEIQKAINVTVNTLFYKIGLYWFFLLFVTIILLFFLGRRYIDVLVNKSLERYKSEIRSDELIEQARWEIKRKTCLKAMDIVDAHWANIEWSGKDSKGRPFDASKVEKQSPPKIEDVRNCYNSLALSCDNEDVLREYKRCLGSFENIQGDAIVDLRNAIRKELGFGSLIDFDRTTAFIMRVNKPSP